DLLAGPRRGVAEQLARVSACVALRERALGRLRNEGGRQPGRGGLGRGSVVAAVVDVGDDRACAPGFERFAGGARGGEERQGDRGEQAHRGTSDSWVEEWPMDGGRPSPL